MTASQMPQADDPDTVSAAGDTSTWLEEHGMRCTVMLARGSAIGI
jgi:hypothetical protein